MVRLNGYVLSKVGFGHRGWTPDRRRVAATAGDFLSRRIRQRRKSTSTAHPARYPRLGSHRYLASFGSSDSSSRMMRPDVRNRFGIWLDACIERANDGLENINVSKRIPIRVLKQRIDKVLTIELFFRLQVSQDFQA